MLTKEQLAKRKNGIYASDIPAIVNASPWETPGDVWMEKTGLGMDGERLKEEREPPSEDMERGNFLERAIIDWTAARTGEPIIPNSTPDGISSTTYRHPRIDWAYATPDGIIYEGEKIDGVVEVKSPSWRTAKEWADPKHDAIGIPKQYLAQVLWQMGCTSASRAVVGALVDGRLWTYKFPFLESGFCRLHEAAQEFWDRVQSGRPPEVKSGSDLRWLSRLFEKEIEQEIYQVSGAEENTYGNIANQYKDVSEQIKDLESVKDLCKAKLQERLGELPGMQGKNWKVYWKSPKDREVIDWEAIARDLAIPEAVIKAHTKKVPMGRRFTVYVK